MIVKPWQLKTGGKILILVCQTIKKNLMLPRKYGENCEIF